MNPKKLIFVFAITLFSMSAIGQIEIKSMTYLPMDKNTNQYIDQESCEQKFYISIIESKFTRRNSQGEIRCEIVSAKLELDKTLKEKVCKLVVCNPQTQESEFYVLQEKGGGVYDLYQDLPSNRIYFSPNYKCLLN